MPYVRGTCVTTPSVANGSLVSDIADEFGKEPSAVSWVRLREFFNMHLLTMQGITVTLMLRSVGALISGSLSDRSVVYLSALAALRHRVGAY